MPYTLHFPDSRTSELDLERDVTGRDAMADLRRKAVETAFYYLRNSVLANCVNAAFLKLKA